MLPVSSTTPTEARLLGQNDNFMKIRYEMKQELSVLGFDIANLFQHDPDTKLRINYGAGATMGKKDIASVLRDDRGGVELRRLQRELKLKRDEICRDQAFDNRDGIAKAYDAGLALLPELWRLEQRMK